MEEWSLEIDWCVALELKAAWPGLSDWRIGPQEVGKALGERGTVREKAQGQGSGEGESEKEKTRKGGAQKSMKEHFQKSGWPQVGQMHRSRGR